MNNTKTYSEHLAKLNVLREEILGIKRDPTAEERKIDTKEDSMTRKIEQVRFAESAPKKKRVAAYARVSSGKDAMLYSLSAQVSYYSDYIQNNGWEYAGVYAVEHLTVYTNGVDTAMRLAEAKIRTVCTGGELLAESLAYVGSAAIDTVRKVYFDAMFFSSAGFDDDVVSDWSEGETELRRVVLEQSAKRYFLADHTKRGERYTHIVCRANELDKIICD